ASGAAGRHWGRLFPTADWLYQPRCEAPADEPTVLDDHGADYSERFGNHSLLSSAATAAEHVSTVRQCGAGGVQLLPAMQLQAGPELSALPARGWDAGCVLSVLRGGVGDRAIG